MNLPKRTEFADMLGRYIMKHFVEPRLRHMVSFYRAEVVTPAAGGKIVVKRPEESGVKTLYCTAAAQALRAGDQCVVFVFGEAANAVVMGSGTLEEL